MYIRTTDFTDSLEFTLSYHGLLCVHHKTLTCASVYTVSFSWMIIRGGLMTSILTKFLDSVLYLKFWLRVQITKPLDSFLSASIRFSWLGGVSPNAIGISPFFTRLLHGYWCFGLSLWFQYTQRKPPLSMHKMPNFRVESFTCNSPATCAILNVLGRWEGFQRPSIIPNYI